MGKKIIILQRTGEPSDYSFSYLLWADVPVARQAQYAKLMPVATTLNPNPVVTAYPEATTAETDAIKAGQVIEKVGQANFPVGTTMSTIQAYLIKEFNQFQSEVNTRNPWVRYGTYWDGTSWVVGGVS